MCPLTSCDRYQCQVIIGKDVSVKVGAVPAGGAQSRSAIHWCYICSRATNKEKAMKGKCPQYPWYTGLDPLPLIIGIDVGRDDMSAECVFKQNEDGKLELIHANSFRKTIDLKSLPAGDN